MALLEIKKLGDPVLLEKAFDVAKEELNSILPQISKMWNLILEFRNELGYLLSPELKTSNALNG